MAGAKNSLDDLKTLGQVLKRVGKKQFGLCLDSAHLFASGYDLRSEHGVRTLEQDVKRNVGGSRSIGCVHLNDAKHPCGSKRDQHENLGVGTIGCEGLAKLLALPMLRHCAVIMETPGFNQLGPDRKNMQRLRSLARLAGQQGHKES
jgi:endonuclease IV